MHPFAKGLLLGLVGAIAVTPAAFGRIVQVPLPRLATIRTLSSSDFMVEGEVRTRTEIDFTLLLRGAQLQTIQVTEDTAIVKNGALIKLADLMVGDKVTATLMRGGDGKLRAVNVTVKTGFE